MQTHENALVDAFVVPSKRARYKELLASSKQRKKILDGLDHLRDLDDRYAKELPSSTNIVELLRSRGAPKSCHVISSVAKLDGREMALQDAIDETEANMSGTIIGCIPGKLAYYYGESGEQRLLLERSN